MEGKSGFFILVGIVAFLSLALAMLAGYVFFVQGDSPKPVTAEDPQKKEIKIPKDDELVKEKLFSEKLPFNLKSNNSEKISVIVVSVEISYYKKVKGIKDPVAKIAAHKSKLQEIVGTYFQGLTLEDVMDEKNAKEKARTELTKKMNDYLLANEKEKQPVVYTVVFDQWFYQ
ncbi:MAG: flagellar basal body-associated FliL family protein [Bacillota bacterium]